MLTCTQASLLHFIDNHVRATGYAPSFDEMTKSTRVRSKSSIHRLISILDERGFIRRVPGKRRSIEVVRLPEKTELTGAVVAFPESGGCAVLHSSSPLTAAQKIVIAHELLRQAHFEDSTAFGSSA